jgi:FtsH-binding integral membrane protein
MESLPHAVTKMFGGSSGSGASTLHLGERRYEAVLQHKQSVDMEAADEMYGPRSDCFVFEAYPEVKKAFIRRVYQILVAQLVLTAGVIYAIRSLYNIDNTISFSGDQDATPSAGKDGEAVGPSMEALSNLFWSGFLGSMVTLTMLHFVARRHPHNLAVLFAFTFFESLLLSSALVFVPAGLLFRALLTTTAVFIGLILYTLESKADYSFLRSYLGSALSIIVVAGFFQLFWPMGSAMDTVYTWFGALVFCGFIIYDTWRLHFQVWLFIITVFFFFFTGTTVS